MGKIENLILQHSGRGMDVLRPYLQEDFCVDTAAKIMKWPKGTVLLTTGFFVAGHAETDGPPGTALLAMALRSFGYEPVIVIDAPCKGYFEQFELPVRYVDVSVCDDVLAELLDELRPAGMISVERCGENVNGDYANMRGVSIAEYTAPIDRLFSMAACPTVGIGDGGNEIGMGNVAEIILRQLSLVPCKTCVDHLVIATVSNWGALGLCAAMGWLPERTVYLHTYEAAKELGYVDGITKQCELGEDGFSLDVGLQLLQDLVSL